MMPKYILMVLLTAQFLSVAHYEDMAPVAPTEKIIHAPKPIKLEDKKLPRVASLMQKNMLFISQLKIRAMDYNTHEEYIIIIDMDSVAKIKIEKNPSLGKLDFELQDSCNSEIEMLES